MNVAAVLAELERKGLACATLERGDDDVRPGWALRRQGSGVELGGWDHGTWRGWRAFGETGPLTPADLEELAEALRRVTTLAEPAAFPRTHDETTRAADLGRQLMDRAAGWAAGAGVGRDPARGVDVLPAAEIKVGTPLDHVGDASGHVLHHFGTSWDARALPDDHRALPVVSYVLVHNLPLACRAERVLAEHGRPGGAWRIVLDAPIAAYVEAGSLRPFVPKEA